jgi:hypothetical protein
MKLRQFWRDDSAESSIMHTISLIVSALSAATLTGFVGTMYNSGVALGSENQAQMESITAAAFFEREGSDARQVSEQDPTKATILVQDGTCITYSLEPSKTKNDEVSFVRTENTCVDDGFLPFHKVLINSMDTTSYFQYINVAGREIVGGEVQGECDPYFTPTECESTVPHVIRVHADTKNPITGKQDLEFTVVTSIPLHQMMVDGDDNVAVTTTIPNDGTVTTAP